MPLRLWWIIVALCVCVVQSYAQTPTPVDPATIKLAEAIIAAPDDTAREQLLAQERSRLTPDVVRAIRQSSHPFWDKSDFVEANRRLLISKQLAERINDQIGIGYVLLNLGGVLDDQQKHPEAMKLYESSLAIFTALNHQRGIADTYGTISGQFYLQSNYAKSVEYNQRALQIMTALDDKAGMANAFLRIGFGQVRQAQLNEAANTYNQAISLFDELKDKTGKAKTLMQLGEVYWSATNYPRAIEALNQAGHLFTEVNNPLLLADVTLRLGNVYDAQGNYDKAVEAYNRAIQLKTEIGDNDGLIAVLSALGSTHKIHFELEEAGKKFSQALTMAKKNGLRRLEPTLWAQIADVYGRKGDHAQAIDSYRQALQLAEELNQPEGKSLALMGLMGIYQKQNNNVLVRYYLTQLLADAEAKENKLEIANMLVLLGFMKEPADGVHDLQRALRIYYELNAKGRAAQTLLSIASLALKQVQYDLAQEHVNQALALYQEIEDSWGIASAWDELGMIHTLRKDEDKAVEYLQRAISLFQAIKRKDTLSTTYANLANAYFQQGKYQEALTPAEKAQSLAQERGTVNEAAVYFIGAAARALKQPEKALQAYREAIRQTEKMRINLVGSEREQQQFFTNNLTPYHGLTDLLVENRREAEALTIAEQSKARVLLDTLRYGRSNIAKALTARELEREQSLKERLVTLNARLYQERVKDPSDAQRMQSLTTQLAQAQNEFDAYQSQLFAAHPELRIQRGESKPLALAEAAALLPDAKTALLEFVAHEDKTFLFVLTKGAAAPNLNVFTLPINRKDLAAKVAAWQAQMKKDSDSRAGADPEYHAALRYFYEVLLKPAQAQLTGKTNLVIVPDGPLWELPFQALLTPRGRFLLEDATISYAPSLTFLRDRAQLRKPATATGGLFALGIGNFNAQQSARTMSASLANLVEVAPTMQAISRFYPPPQRQVLLDAQATEERFKAQAGQYRILQFMTHGLLNNQSPMYSQIVLAPSGKDAKEDGVLEAWELMKLDLQAELAILGACDTGRGGISNGEGVIGLSWALFVAGVPNTVVSQWSVNSAATKELMIEFHRQLTTKPQQTKAESLRQASLKLLRSEKFYAPYYWASFVLVGDGK